MGRLFASVSSIVILYALLANTATAQQIGDRYRLVDREQGIPGHAEAFQRAVSYRYTSRTEITILDLEDNGHWLEVIDDAGNAHWIIDDYLDAQVTANVPVPPPAELCYNVAAWNLEHFGHASSRGFPENTSGGPSFGPRTQTDIEKIAQAIRDEFDFKILMLSEINGYEADTEDGTVQASEELDDLTRYLGSSWDYIIAASGRKQRVAIIWDKAYARLNAHVEIYVPDIYVQGSNIFDRDPLAGHFTFINNGTEMNDLLAVALHLASGQSNNKNHDAAMNRLLDELDNLRSEGIVLPADEYDILLGGDLNANKFDTKYVEEFFTDMDQGDWDVLADPGYPPTRINRFDNIPTPGSIIDYLIVTTSSQTQDGLSGDEITTAQATVHGDLLDDLDEFRATYSDHFPVSTCVEVRNDTD